MKEELAAEKTWNVFYFYGEKVTVKANARFGRLTLLHNAIQIAGDDNIVLTKSEIQAIDLVTVPIWTSALRIKAKDFTIIVGREWFHLTRSVIISWFIRDMRDNLLSFIAV